MSEANKVNVAIIGAGPAGITAAIYLQRAGWKPTLFERKEPGGLLRNARFVENYPGFPNGISGKSLVDRFIAHLKKQNVSQINTEVRKLSRMSDEFEIITDETAYQALAVIIAIGTKPIKMKFSKTLDASRKIFYEVAEIPRHSAKGKKFTIIGGGDAAFDYALTLKSYGADVTILIRTEPCCLTKLEKIARKKGVRIFINSNPTSIRSTDRGLRIKYESCEKLKQLETDYLVIACGRAPVLSILDEKLAKKLRNFKGTVKTSIPGLYFAGDVIQGRHRQTGTAVGDGINAAMFADEYLKTKA